MAKLNPIVDVISEHDDLTVILNAESHSFPAETFLPPQFSTEN